MISMSFNICVRQTGELSAYRDGFDPVKLVIRDRMTDHSRALGAWAGFTGRRATMGWLVLLGGRGREGGMEGKEEGLVRMG